jgi:PIN domain nuclease of toxin-antitoxin system
MATVWEIAIKSGIGKLTLSGSYSSFMAQAIAGYGLVVLPITVDDCVKYEGLPFPLKDHRDPFDRIIITQARV